jgi:glycosyltransferase involved in cell wall biosynthesis
MNPLVSVIIPVYNGERFLAEAIQTATAQDYRPIEIVVADDGSSDGSREVARSFAEVQLLELPHGGVSVARNEAVAASSGEWLAFLDADDLWYPGKLSAQVAAGSASDRIGIVLCEQMHQFDSVPAWWVWPTDPKSKTCFEPSAWLVRRKVFDLVGGFEPGRALGEDLNWLMRAWSLGVKHRVVRETLMHRRIHDANVSAQLPTAELQMIALIRESVAIKRRMREEGINA